MDELGGALHESVLAHVPQQVVFDDQCVIVPAGWWLGWARLEGPVVSSDRVRWAYALDPELGFERVPGDWS